MMELGRQTYDHSYRRSDTGSNAETKHDVRSLSNFRISDVPPPKSNCTYNLSAKDDRVSNFQYQLRRGARVGL